MFNGIVFLNVFTTLSVSDSMRSNFQSVEFETMNVTITKFENFSIDFIEESAGGVGLVLFIFI
jgi:hypothetical protein